MAINSWQQVKEAVGSLLRTHAFKVLLQAVRALELVTVRGVVFLVSLMELFTGKFHLVWHQLHN